MSRIIEPTAPACRPTDASKSTDRFELPAWAAGYIGLPFAEKGRDRAGYDCWGLYRLIVADRAGLALPCFATSYDRPDDGPTVEAAIRTFGTESDDWLPISRGDERLFDAVEMRGIYQVRIDGKPVLRRANMHVGLVLAQGTLIHMERQVSSALGIYWRDRGVGSRIVGFWRHRELADV